MLLVLVIHCMYCDYSCTIYRYACVRCHFPETDSADVGRSSRWVRVMLLLSMTSASLFPRGHHVQTVLNVLPKSSNSTTYFYNEATLDHFGGVAGKRFWPQRY